MSILYSCIMVGMVGGSALAAFATRHVSRPAALMAASALMTLAAGFFLPACAKGAHTLAAGVLLLWGLGMGMYALLIFSAMMDAAAPVLSSVAVAPVGAGLLLGLLISTGKIGDSLGGVLTGALLSWSGYVPNAASSDHVLNSLRSSYTTVALVTMGLSLVALLPIWRRPSSRPSSASEGRRAA
jgi:Na+/melibiose symporter-like transporter